MNRGATNQTNKNSFRLTQVYF